MQKKAFFLFLLKILRLPLTVINLRVIATYFGVSFERDVWILVFAAVTFFDTAIWGPINETFRARFVSQKEQQGESYAMGEVRSLLFFITIISCGMAIFLMCFSETIAGVLAPNYNGREKAVLIAMICYTAPFLVINQLTLIGVSLLNAYNFFYMPEIAGFITSIVTILVIVFLAPSFGIYSLLIGYYITALLMLGIIVLKAFSLKLTLFSGGFGVPTFIGFSRYFLFAVPFFLPYFFGQLNSVIEKTLSASLGTGMVAILDYSRRVPDLMNAIVLSLITSMLVPVLTKHFINKEIEKFNFEFRKMFQLGLLVIGAINIAMIVSGKYVVSILYGSKSIDGSSMESITKMSIFYSISLYGIFFYVIFGMCMLSCNKAKLYASLGVLVQLIVIGLNLGFKSLLGIYIFPISVFIAHFLGGILMSNSYPFFNNRLKYVFIKYVLYSIVSGGSLIMIKQALLSNFLSNSPSFLIATLSFGALQILVMLFFLFVFKIEEREYIKNACNFFVKKL